MTFDHIDVVPVLGLDPFARTDYSCGLARRLDAERVSVAVGRGRDTDDVLRDILWDLRAAGCERTVLDVGEEALATEIVGSLASIGARARALVAVVDAARAETILRGEASLRRIHDGGDGTFDVPLAVLLTSQLEYATTLVLAGGVGRTRVREFAAGLGPRSEIVDWDGTATPPRRVGDLTLTLPGWLHVINGSACPEGGVSVVRYQRERPFHPGRLMELLEGETEWGSLVRVAGFARIASKPGVLCLWEQTCQTISVDPYETDWWVEGRECDDRPSQVGDVVLGQDLVAIGTDVDAAGLVRDLDACLLTDEEFLDGVRVWTTYEDAFP